MAVRAVAQGERVATNTNPPTIGRRNKRSRRFGWRLLFIATAAGAAAFTLMLDTSVGQAARAQLPGAALTISNAAPIPSKTPQTAAAPAPRISRAQTVCSLPRPRNNGRVLGHDVGFSVKKENSTTSYWFFGDTIIDLNGNGRYDHGEFATGTIAKSNDTNPDDCIDLTYGTDASNRFAAPAVTPTGDECFTWPYGGVNANGGVYFTYSAMLGTRTANGTLDCDFNRLTGEIRLAKINDDGGTDGRSLSASKVGTRPQWTATQLQFTRPVRIGDYVHFFAVDTPAAADGTNNAMNGQRQYYLARVLHSDIEHTERYEFAAGRAWSRSISDARPIFDEGMKGTASENSAGAFGDTGSVAYNAMLGRYVMWFSCGFLTSAVCTRTAVQAGPDASALTAGWNPAESQYTCPTEGIRLFPCYQTFAHEWMDNGTDTYVTYARHPGDDYLAGGRYGVVLERYTTDVAS